ncbi:MAG: tetratricopeptide repeat protein, partial [Elusimicrobia bacterium]|nr:tetratricopeptide repeat protein [Elusimicrobiota bacterium]
MPKRSVIKCSKCGYESNIVSATCKKCEGKVDKICGECGFKNTPFKSFCVQCNKILALTDPPEETKNTTPQAPKEKMVIEMQSISDTMGMEDDMGSSTTVRINTSPDTAYQIDSSSDTNNPAIKRASSTPPPFITKKTSSAKPPVATKSNSSINVLITLGLSAALIAILYLIATPYIPKMKLLIKTKQYLNHLSKGNYEDAYKMLSSNSQASCTMDTYVKNTKSYYSIRPKWEFKEINVFKIEEKIALIKYKLKEGDGEWTDDYLSFVKEGDSWARPYIWNLFQPIDEAFAKADFSTALYLAQKLYLIDPLDPRTLGYLCTAEYNLGLYTQATVSCKKTIDTSEIYPVGFDEKAKTWYYFQLANSLKFTKNYEPAFKIYRNLLSNKNASKTEQCQILLTRSDAYAAAKKYNEALKDILIAQTICPPDFQDDLKTFLSYLTGTSTQEAIVFAQKSEF